MTRPTRRTPPPAELDPAVSASRWYFIIGGLDTGGEQRRISSAVRIDPLRRFPDPDELDRTLKHPLVAGIISHHGSDVLRHQLVIDTAARPGGANFGFVCDSARAILAGLRIRTGGELFCPAVGNRPWDGLNKTDGLNADANRSPVIAGRFEPHAGGRGDEPAVTIVDDEDLIWVRDHLSAVLKLNADTRFAIALDALCSYLTTGRDRMRAAQLWVGIEAIFEVQYEISYRLPLLASLMLHPRGPDAIIARDRIKKLYAERSAAVHGRQFKHAARHVAEVRRLLADLLSVIVRRGDMPSKTDFDHLVLMPEQSPPGG